MNDNYKAVTKALGLLKNDLEKLARNAVEASFADDADKQAMRKKIDAYMAAHQG